MTHIPPVTLPVEAVRQLLFSSNAEVQAQFKAHFPNELERLEQGIAGAHRALDMFRNRLEGSMQTATLETFLHSAMNSVLSSGHLLVSGYPIPSGNLMRHYCESMAMALLCLEPRLGFLEAYSSDRKNFPIHTATTKLRRAKVQTALKLLIGFDSVAWEAFLEIAKHYDQLSHASALSLGHQLMLATDNMSILGGEFDPAKREPYRLELVRRASAAESLERLIADVTQILA